MDKIRSTICQLFHHVADPWFLVNLSLPSSPLHWHYPIFVCRTININTVLDALMKAKHGFRSRLYSRMYSGARISRYLRVPQPTDKYLPSTTIHRQFFSLFFFFFSPPLISYTRSVKIFRYRCCSHVAAFRPGYAYTNSICYLNSVKYLPFHEIRSAPLSLRKDIISLFFD